MKRNSLFTLLLILSAALLMSACSKKEPMPQIEPSGYTLELGQSLTVSPTAPVEGAAGTLGEIPQGLEVEYAEGQMTLQGNVSGSYSLQLTFSAEGYEDGAVIIPVTVKEEPPPQLMAAAFSETLGLNAAIPEKKPISFSIFSGDAAGVDISTKVNDYIVSVTSDSNCLEASTDGEHIVIKASEEGKAILTITVSSPGYTDAVANCTVEVKTHHSLQAGKNTPA